ncbi:hypothetical protein CF335_g2973 [Tilletia laevis]|nr:hypothetical protein CF335_g2973 [Tilletia laevis]
MSSLCFHIAGASASASTAVASAGAVGARATTSTLLAAAAATQPNPTTARRSFSTTPSTSGPKGTSPKAHRAHERTLRSAIELYHLGPSFFPTPAQTAGFGALASPPEPEAQAHGRALDSVIRSSIQIMMDMESGMRNQTKNMDIVRPVLALRTGDLLENLEKPRPAKDGRAAGGPVYDPSQPAPPLMGRMGGSGGRFSSDSRVGPEAERSLDRIFAPKRSATQPRPSSSNLGAPFGADNNRSKLRFIAPRHQSSKQAANQDILTLHARHSEALRVAGEERKRYTDPYVGTQAPPSFVPALPQAVLKALKDPGLLPERDGGEIDQVQTTGVRGTSGTARMDRLDERAARVRDALFGTVAAELPGLEILQERRRLRQLKEQM